MINGLNSKGRSALLTSAALLAFTIAAPAAAQDQPQQTAPPQDQRLGNENNEAIVVTAQKRAQVLIDVPQSVTVVGGDTLDRQQATSFKDFLALVPGLSVEGSTPGVTRITLRGVNTGGVASTVSVYMDEVPFGSSTGLANGAILSGDFDTFDLNRLEVLRGPQGTLYGASSLGGVIKYVSNPPRIGRFEGKAQAGLETTKDAGKLGYNGAGVLNVPLGDKAAIRVDGFIRKQGGYINSIGNNPILNLLTGEEIGRTLVAKDINDKKSYGGRASVLLQATPDLSVRLTAFAQDLKSGGSSLFEVDPHTLKPLYGGLTQSLYVREPNHIKYRVYSGLVNWDFGFANLTSSTSWSKFNESFDTDFTFALGSLVNLLANLGPLVPLLGLPPEAIIADPAVTRPLSVLLVQDTSTDKFTQEVRLASPASDKFEWLLGAFYTHEKSAIDPQNVFATEFGTHEIAPDVKPLYLIFLRSTYKEYAGFANGTWHASPHFDLTVGARWSHNNQNASESITGPLTLGNPVSINGVKSSEGVFTYSVAPRYEFNKNVAVYARVASGYRPGGPNVLPINAPPGTPLTYKADRLTSYEIGVKAQAPNNLWTIDAAAYHLDWKDIQLFAIINDIGLNANGGKARVNGVELTSSLRPVRGLTLTANAAYTDAKLTQDTPNPEITGGFKGDPLPYTSKWSWALNGDYDFPLMGQTGFVGATINHVGRRAVNLNERLDDKLVRIPGYTEFDLRAGANIGRFTIEAFARNLFDKRGLETASGFDGGTYPNGAAAASIIRPRTIGLTLTAGFGS
jgi:outer membrane receptor protein involved in Fe transport